MSRSKKIGPVQQTMFSDDSYKNSSPSKRALHESIIRKQEELRVGQLDFDRYRPDRKKYEEAASTKHSRVARVNGELIPVIMAQSIVKFLNSWVRRRSQLVWEIDKLKKSLD